MKSIYKIFHPEIFQGSLKGKNYFEGWYFKHVTGSGDKAFAVIPGVSLSDDSHCFIQFIDGTSGKTGYFRYPLNKFHFDPRKLDLSVGNSRFRGDSIQINLENEEMKITGDIQYSEIVKLPSTISAPGIMGWYSYIFTPWPSD